jgi:hypothetical protein
MKTPWKIFSVACIATILPGSALAAELHIFAQSDTLYTYNTGTNSLSSVTTKDASGAPVKLSALAFDPNGVLWGQRPDQTNFTNGEFFTVDLTTGIVSYKFLMPINPALGTRGNMNTFDFRKNGSTVEILGFVDRGGGGQDSFERIDTLGNSKRELCNKNAWGLSQAETQLQECQGALRHSRSHGFGLRIGRFLETWVSTQYIRQEDTWALGLVAKFFAHSPGYESLIFH